jgi:hypothetical protein
MTPLAAPRVLDQFFLEARCRLLDLAAILDRIDRGENASVTDADPRMKRIQQALQVLLEPRAERAVRIQELFSLEYDPDWKRPEPR